MFWQCPAIESFWNTFMRTMCEKCPGAQNVPLTEPLVILGVDNRIDVDSTMYFILVLAKQYIYRCKLGKTKPVLQGFIKKLQHRWSVDEYIARKNFTHTDFVAKWLPYRAFLTSYTHP